MDNDVTTLYHFTTLVHVPRIFEAGFLKLAESNVSLKRVDAGPQVVWLTTAETPDAGHGLQGSAADKTRVRFTVRLPVKEVHEWEPWTRAHGSVPSVIRTLAASGGSETWRVIERPIPSSEWVEVRDMPSWMMSTHLAVRGASSSPASTSDRSWSVCLAPRLDVHLGDARCIPGHCRANLDIGHDATLPSSSAAGTYTDPVTGTRAPAL